MVRILSEPGRYLALKLWIAHIARNEGLILIHTLEHECFEQIAEDERELVFRIHLRCLLESLVSYSCFGQLIEEQLVSLIEIRPKSFIEVINELGERNRLLSHYSGADFFGAIKSSAITI